MSAIRRRQSQLSSGSWNKVLIGFDAVGLRCHGWFCCEPCCEPNAYRAAYRCCVPLLSRQRNNSIVLLFKYGVLLSECYSSRECQPRTGNRSHTRMIMKKFALVALSLLLALPALASGGHGGHSSGRSAGASHHATKPATGTGTKLQREHVGSYTKKTGARVAAHDRSTKDSTRANNWSTKGNTNPETGKAGTK
jgi:hypothetical protein